MQCFLYVINKTGFKTGSLIPGFLILSLIKDLSQKCSTQKVRKVSIVLNKLQSIKSDRSPILSFLMRKKSPD